MYYKTFFSMAILACALSACHQSSQNTNVVSQTYVHKYGYAVSPKEWKEKGYPGQVISLLKTGVTVTATYEDNLLHGPCTYSFPNSNTVEKYVLYNQGQPMKEVLYDISGMPIQETLQQSEGRQSLVTWYLDGVPKSIEIYAKGALLQGEYFSKDNTLEARVEEGKGMRVLRDKAGLLTCKDLIENGLLVCRESFYASGTPESVAHYYQGLLEGKRQVFSQEGEPLCVEEWAAGHLHGLCTYFKNGAKDHEIMYSCGKKHGLETHFLDGQTILHQISWVLDHKHGKEVFFLPNNKKVVWNYDNKEVSQDRFEELAHLDSVLLQDGE
ncbi:MAG: hypothetical protein FJZ58_01115 [Chlamydiae bacterium]|nr:hypothetical protein [Chlamydiota bacterium]